MVCVQCHTMDQIFLSEALHQMVGGNGCLEISNYADALIFSYRQNRPTMCKAKDVKSWTKKQLQQKMKLVCFW